MHSPRLARICHTCEPRICVLARRRYPENPAGFRVKRGMTAQKRRWYPAACGGVVHSKAYHIAYFPRTHQVVVRHFALSRFFSSGNGSSYFSQYLSAGYHMDAIYLNERVIRNLRHEYDLKEFLISKPFDNGDDRCRECFCRRAQSRHINRTLKAFDLSKEHATPSKVWETRSYPVPSPCRKRRAGAPWPVSLAGALDMSAEPGIKPKLHLQLGADFQGNFGQCAPYPRPLPDFL